MKDEERIIKEKEENNEALICKEVLVKNVVLPEIKSVVWDEDEESISLGTEFFSDSEVNFGIEGYVVFHKETKQYRDLEVNFFTCKDGRSHIEKVNESTQKAMNNFFMALSIKAKEEYCLQMDDTPYDV